LGRPYALEVVRLKLARGTKNTNFFNIAQVCTLKESLAGYFCTGVSLGHVLGAIEGY